MRSSTVGVVLAILGVAASLAGACGGESDGDPAATTTGTGTGASGQGGSGGDGGGEEGGSGGGEGGHGGEGGQGGGASGGGGGSGGSGLSCEEPEDCPGTDTDCLKRACVDGACAVEPMPEGQPTSQQTDGDCLSVVCDGSGGEKAVADDDDTGDAVDVCTVGACSNGVPSSSAAPAGAACSAGKGKLCNGFGVCVECLAPKDCGPGLACDHNSCVDAGCVDGQKSGGETDVDCGGPLCKKCADLAACLVDGDCLSGICAQGVCVLADCDDGVQNADETDVDCGGPTCLPCDDGKSCELPEDCESGTCDGMPKVCVAPSCDDGLSNGAETDVDCGGPACDPCGPGSSCEKDDDCAGSLCEPASWTCTPTCTDGVTNGGEGDVDCGGPCPKDCKKGQSCHEGTDCESGVCTAQICG